jgi:hypothetical protein
MDYFRTEVVFKPSPTRMRLTDSVLTIGSCFSDAMGSQLISNKLRAQVNPFGINYNPHSIHKAIRYAIFNREAAENFFVARQGLTLHYDFHSRFSSISKLDLQKQLLSAISDTHNFLGNANWLIITYGTAWVYELVESDEIVANCHKMPQSFFKKFLLTQKKILDSFESMYAELKKFNPGIQIILTVSPVRHIKETLELNSVSKSVLRVACDTLSRQHTDVQYFPSYEILLDDLRDYRFYKPDMIHPSEVAEDYIWQKFGERYFDNDLKQFISKWKEIRSALDHRPFHPGSPAHQKFVAQTIKKLEELKDLIDVDKEIASLKKQQSA